MRNEDGRTSPPFQLRTAASKNVLERMTEQELKNLNDTMEEMGEDNAHGVPDYSACRE